MAYLRVCHEVRSFILLTPNTIVRERLARDLRPKIQDANGQWVDNPDWVWKKFNLFPRSTRITCTI